jgi:hypothetical protein
MRTFLKAIPALLIIIIGFVILGAIGWLVVSWFSGLGQTTQTAVAGLTGVVLAPLVAFLTTRALERRRILESNLREKKTALYEQMVKDLMSAFDIGNSKKTKNPNAVVQAVAAFTPRLIAYGSRSVIRAWNTFRLGLVNDRLNAVQRMAAFEDVLKQMRKDLGHGTFLQQRGELLGLWINDIENVDFKAMTMPPAAVEGVHTD